MKITDLPFGTVDWEAVESTTHAGVRGEARWRTRRFGDVRVRMLDYSAGYEADHWCSKGHFLLCLAGELETELADGRRFILRPGMSYHVADGAEPHRSRAPAGARLFVVDRRAMDDYEISTDPARLDVDAMHAYLTRSYWSPGIPLETVARAARNSLCFGAYERATGRQVGLARVVTDHATFAYLCDVYVLEEHQGRGLGKRLVDAVMAHPALTGARRAMLGTRDAHGLYARHGFRKPPDDGVLMQILRPDMYRGAAVD